MKRGLRSAAALFVAGFALACAPAKPVPDGVTAWALTGGHWYDGSGFVLRDMYIVGSELVARRPERIDSIVDLSGGWVVPPFGDAHTHNLDGAFRFEEMRAAYTAEGTFYLQVLTNTTRGAAAVRDSFAMPGGLDIRYANAGLTSTLGHPFLAYEPRALGIFTAEVQAARSAELCRSRIRLGDAYWFIDDRAALDSIWPQWLATEPDVAKIFLLNADDGGSGASCENMGHHGLDPELVPAIVERAHDAGLRVWAHVESARDFELAVLAGADGIAHLPGYQLDPGEADEPFLIEAEAAAIAGERGVYVTPTASLAAAVHEDDAASARILDLHRRNIALLRASGVRFVVGSDFYGRTARDEVETLRAMGVWTDAELLRMWAETTPTAIFPDRRIGRLRDGFEASFLVLECDPLNDWACTAQIRAIVKDGLRIAAQGSGRTR